MTTPVLTKKQQKQSLSSKKGLVKGLRNVLAQPQEFLWPVLKGDKCSVVEELLCKAMIPLRRPKLKIPWYKLRRMNKEERIQAKKKVQENEDILPHKDVMDSITMGINEVTRALEKNNICCVLLDSKVEPPLLIKHIVIMAQNKKIPLLLVPFMKAVTLTNIGYASAAVAFKNIVKNSINHYLYTLYKEIVDIYVELPQPKRLLEIFMDDETIPDTSNEMSMQVDKIYNNETSETNVPKSRKPFVLPPDIYKYRSSLNERAFVPSNAVQNIQIDEKTDFIPVNIYSDSDDSNENMNNLTKKRRYIDLHEEKKEIFSNFSEKNNTELISASKEYKASSTCKVKKRKKDEVTYLPLKIRRIRGNINRVKATKTAKRKKK